VSVPWLEARLARIKGSSASRKDGGEQAQRRAVEQWTAAPAPPQMDVRIATQVLTAGMEQAIGPISTPRCFGPRSWWTLSLLWRPRMPAE